MPQEDRSSGRRGRGARTPAHRRPRRRLPRVVRSVVYVLAAAGGTATALVMCAILGVRPFNSESLGGPQAGAGSPVPTGSATTRDANSAVPTPLTQAVTTSGPPIRPRALPLGPSTSATIPPGSTQVVVVRGDAAASSLATAELYQRVKGDWVPISRWRGHVGKNGWTTRHVEGDLKTPVGTFTLSAAGGRKPNPGAKLPYYRSAAFIPPPTEPGFGDWRADTFDYVVAIDYNRVPGRSPLDPTRPLGAHRGGGIWLHGDHSGPTHGCVSLPDSGVRELLQRLHVESRPVMVMGDSARLRL